MRDDTNGCANDVRDLKKSGCRFTQLHAGTPLLGHTGQDGKVTMSEVNSSLLIGQNCATVQHAYKLHVVVQ